MSVTISSFNVKPTGFSVEQIKIFNNADIFLCETKETFHEVMSGLGIWLGDKEIFYVYENMYEDANFPTPDLIDYIKLKSETKNIVIVSDDGFPDIVDPYTGVISELVKSNIHIDIMPNVSSLVSARILSGMDVDEFVFGGVLTEWDGEIEHIDKKYSQVSNYMPVIFFIVIPSLEWARVVFNKICEVFGDERSATILFNMGHPTAQTYRCLAKELYDKHELHYPDPFTLVVHP